MRFHYVPSTYRGRKFGKGFCGGAYRGCARICGGSLGDNAGDTPGPVAVPVNIPVEPAQIQQNLLDFPNITPEMIERARNIIAIAEATGKAQPITKKEAGIWSGIKNIGSKIWSGAKAVASNPLVQTAAGIAAPYLIGAVAPALASYVPKALDNVGRYAYNKLDPIYHQEAIVNKSAGDNFQEIKDNLSELASKGVANTASAVAAAPAAIYNSAANILKSGWNRFWNKRGSGYRGGRRARLRKGSPEAKAYMARLRAMRGKKKKSGHGYRGGMFRGVSLMDLADLIREANENKKPYIHVNWVDSNGKKRMTTVGTAEANKMIEGTTKIQKFYDDKDRSVYLTEHYGEKAWPYKKMSAKRHKNILRLLSNHWMTYPQVCRYYEKRTEKDPAKRFMRRWWTWNVDTKSDPLNTGIWKKGSQRLLDYRRRDSISRARLDLMKGSAKRQNPLFINGKKSKKSKKSKKTVAAASSFVPILSPVAAATAASTSVNGSAAPPPPSILPANDDDDNDYGLGQLGNYDDDGILADVLGGDNVIPNKFEPLKSRLDNMLVRATEIEDVKAREQIMRELNAIGDNDLAILASKYINKKPWKADDKNIRKKLNKLTGRITAILNNQ